MKLKHRHQYHSNLHQTHESGSSCLIKGMKYFFENSVSPLKKGAKRKKVNEFYESFLIYWWIFKITGILPIKVTDDGVKLNWISLQYLYSIVIYSALTYPIFLQFSKIFRIFLIFDGNFEDVIIIVGHAVLLFCYFTFPFTHWLEMKTIESVFQNWKEFQDDYETTTGDPIPMVGRRCMAKHFLLLILITIGFLIITKVKDEMHLNNWEIAIAVYVCFILSMHFSFIISNADFLLQVVKGLKWNMRKVMRERKYHLLARYNVLWVRVAELSQSVGDIFHKIYGIIFVFLFIIITMNAYSVFQLLQVGFEIRRAAATMNFFFMVYLIYVVCEKGHIVSKRIGDDFMDDLTHYKTALLDAEVQDELEIFVGSIFVIPHKISCNGYFVIERKLMVSMLSTMITYLVVVVQFSMV